MSELLNLTDISKHYGDFKALQEVTLSVKADELVAIIGPNGAGKTTLVNVITGLLKPTTGKVTFKGEDIAGVGPVQLGRRGMARAFQLVHIFPELTVRDTLAVAAASRLGRGGDLFRSLGHDAEIRAECEQVAAIFGLTPLLEAQARTLSQGAKKLLDVASAFALKPELILLDEPTSGVSTSDKHNVMRVLLDAAKAAGIRSIILVEHDMELVSKYSNRIVALQEGRVLADLPPAQFFRNEKLVSVVAGKPPVSYQTKDADAVHY
jgi:branched-chain amino acid transport system ATP-binding protein